MVQGQTPGVPPPPGPPEAGGEKLAPWVFWLLGGVGIALVVLAVMTFTGGGGESDTTLAGSSTTRVTQTTDATSTTSPTTSEATTSTTLGPGEAPGEIFLETAASNGPEPFTGEVFAAPVVTTTAPVVTMPPTTTTSSTTTTTSATGTTAVPPAVVTGVSGNQPGIYGGTNNQSQCDKGGMLAFLQANPDKAAAWVAALNADPTLAWGDGRTSLTVDDLPAYFDELTPVALLFDTRVTNHGFRDGRPTPRQSVLQAGTAVLVDVWGVPRARCACGNPLTPPRPASTPPDFVGPPWPGFDPTIIIVVIPSDVAIEQIVIIDLVTGGTIGRPVGTTGQADVVIIIEVGPPMTIPPDVDLGTGDVQVTLIWASDADLDLHVIDPTGWEIYFGAETSPSGGFLDVDDIPDAGDASPHVENIFWPGGGAAPQGDYVAWVYYYDSWDDANATYTLEVRVGDRVIHSETNALAPGQESARFVFPIEGGPYGSFNTAVDWALASGLPIEDPAVCDADEAPGTYCIGYAEDLGPGERVYVVAPQGLDAAPIWLLLYTEGPGWVVAETAESPDWHPW